MGAKRRGAAWYRIVSRRAVARGDLLRSLRGRFHQDPDSEPTTYVADSAMTAWLEVSARFGRVPADPRAFRLFRVTPASAKLADLREPAQQTRLKITLAELLADPAPAICREVARRLRRTGTGCHGLIYPSLRNRPDGLCAALFLERVVRIAVEPAEEEWRELAARRH